MIAFDSSCWIEVWRRPGAIDEVREAAKRVGASLDRVLVPAPVVYETRRWLLASGLPHSEIDRLAAQVALHEVVPFDDRLAGRAALTGVTAQLAFADAAILTTSRLRFATLLTYDRDFDGLPGVVVLA